MPTVRPHLRGARPSPAHKIFATPKYHPGAVPEFFGVVPPELSFWDNSQYGDCVSAEEAAAKAQFSLMFGGTTELFIPQDEVVSWASANGFLNGADLISVMDAMARSGMTATDGRKYGDGPYQAVDWTNDATLSSAIYQGPVKLAVAANQLDPVWSGHPENGWIAIGFNPDQAIDHCVNLCGFGSLQELCDLLGVSVPSGQDPTKRSYLMFTWSTIGIIDRSSMMAITAEAYVRLPTTVVQSAKPPKHQAPPTASGPSSPKTVDDLKMILSGVLGLLNK